MQAKDKKQQKTETEILDKLSKEEEDLADKGLAKVIKPKEPIVNINFDNYAKNVEGILINPKWNLD